MRRFRGVPCQIPADASLAQFPIAAAAPLFPLVAAQPSHEPRLQQPELISGRIVEVRQPTPQIIPQLSDKLPKGPSASALRQFPYPRFHASYGLVAQPYPRLSADTETQEEPFAGACHRAFGFVHLQFQMPVEVLSDGGFDPLARPSTLDVDIASSGAGEFHPHALTEPDVNLSVHPALIVQPPVPSPSASVQNVVARGAPSAPASILHVADGAEVVCISAWPTSPAIG